MTETPSIVRHEIYLSANRELYVAEIDTWTGKVKYFPLYVKDGKVVADMEEQRE